LKASRVSLTFLNMKPLKDILRLPLLNRCHEVALYFDLASLKDLHDSFPMLIRSLLYDEGGLGWRIRFVTREHTPVESEALYNFFHPISGPLFRMLYRLTGESLKYLVPFYDLSKKLQDTLNAGTFPSFYKDMVYIDPFQNQIVGLQMSPFDYFLHYFALHGTFPLNNIMLTGMPRMQEHERVKSLYVTLSSLYVITFLPTDTRRIVLPQNVAMLVRTMPEITPAKIPKKAIKYLLPHRLDLDMSSEQSEVVQPESARIVHWRSTSIMHIFLDVWFGMDVRSPNRLPTLEQIRCMRVLVKKLHAFSICADMCDSISFVELRKTAREKLSAYFNEIFICLIFRWPLYDGTLVDVMELWLSYIQPWRYQPTPDMSVGPFVEQRYEQFITSNLQIYTQPFLILMQRVLDADLSRAINTCLVYRPCRVFAQNNLLLLLRQRERLLLEHKQSDKASPSVTARSVEPFEQQHQPAGSLPNAASQPYVPLFSDEAALDLRKTLRKLRSMKALINKNNQEQKRLGPRQLFQYLMNLPTWGEEEREAQSLLARLTFAEETLTNMFHLPSAEEDPFVEPVSSDSADSGVSSTFVLSGEAWIDPALQPIRSGENTFLVRFLHTVSCMLQLMFGTEIQSLWQYNHVPRMLARQLLLPPCTIHRFVRQSDGSKQLTAVQLPGRICLRFLASYKVLAIIVCSFLLGGVLFGAPSYGFIALILLVLSCNLLSEEETLPPVTGPVEQ
uniref:Uncharacterized protein n=2 Tax=Anopheles atroparvus TaxID=41427 RepID=A0A182J6T2_ANOAO